MQEKKRMIGEWVITVLMTGLILVLTVPLLIGAGYTYPAADDFILENGSLTWIKLIGPVWGPLRAAWGYFLEWQGAYTSNFFQFTVMPYNRFGLNGFRCGMVLLSLLFVGALYFMVNAIINLAQATESENNLHGKQNKKLFLYVVLLFTAFGLPGTWIGKELFYWYTATLGYLIGISFLFISIGCFLLAHCHRKKKGYYICSMVFGFAASGVSPQVASFVCSWLLIALLLVIVSAKIDGKRICFLDFCPFVVSFCGAVINVAAPGTMRRSQSTLEGEAFYNVIDAIKDTFKYQKEELSQIWHDPVFIALMVILFLGCMCFKVRVVQNKRMVNWISVILVFVGVAASNFLCIFPVVLGYHGGGLSNDRTKYVAEFEIRFSLLFAIMYTAQYISYILSRKGKENRTFYLVSIMCGVCVCAGGFLFLNDHPEELFSGYSFELIKELSNGTVQEIFSMRKAVLEDLEAAEEGTDVYLKLPPLPSSRIAYPQGISNDVTTQTNQDIASMFHLNSVAVEYGVE